MDKVQKYNSFNRLRVFENRVVKRIFGYRRETGTVD
jgi:hypothetical protein